MFFADGWSAVLKVMVVLLSHAQGHIMGKWPFPLSQHMQYESIEAHYPKLPFSSRTQYFKGRLNIFDSSEPYYLSDVTYWQPYI